MTATQARTQHNGWKCFGAAACCASAILTSGCTLVGGAMESYRESSTKVVEPDYLGLEGKSYAVLVTAERSIQADHPSLVDYLTGQMTARLAASTNLPRAGGFVPAAQVLKYVYSNPGWTARGYADVAKELGGVDRLIVVEVIEFRLHDPGNQYLWDGIAGGTVSVIETDSLLADDVAYNRAITVDFPDQQGYGPNEMSEPTVRTELARRLLDRASWLFYSHDEPYYPEY